MTPTTGGDRDDNDNADTMSAGDRLRALDAPAEYDDPAAMLADTVARPTLAFNLLRQLVATVPTEFKLAAAGDADAREPYASLLDMLADETVPDPEGGERPATEAYEAMTEAVQTELQENFTDYVAVPTDADDAAAGNASGGDDGTGDGTGDDVDFNMDRIEALLRSATALVIDPGAADGVADAHPADLAGNWAADTERGGPIGRDRYVNDGSGMTTTAGTLRDHRANDRGPDSSYGSDHARPGSHDGVDLDVNSREPATAGTLRDYRDQQAGGRGGEREADTDHDPAAGVGSLGGRDKYPSSPTNEQGERDATDGPRSAGTLRDHRELQANSAGAGDGMGGRERERRVGVTVEDGRVRSRVQGGGTSKKPPTYLKRAGRPQERGSRGYALMARKLRRDGRWGPWEIPRDDEIGE